MKMKKNVIFPMLILVLLISACNIGGQAEEVKPLFIGANKVFDQTKADEAKQLVLSMEEVVEVKGVNKEENIYIATKVKQFDRFFLDRIRKEAQDKIKKRFPEANVHVSTDKKVFLELEKLERNIYQNRINKESVEKQIKKIEDFMTG